jgi:ribonuclease D
VHLPPFRYIDAIRSWRDCLAELREQPRLALDLEANSLYAYRERVCLIQISTDRQDYILDPTAITDLSGLGALIEDSRVEKVFHAAEYDLILMKQDYGWALRNLFDTMWAARILGYERCGLANLLADKYGVQVNKKYQKANWCRRPLPEAQLRYAQADTHYLLALRDELDHELRRAWRLDEAIEIFEEQTRVEPTPRTFDPDDFWSVNGVDKLSRRQQAIARRLNSFREDEARRRDRPPFKIFDNRTLLALAERQAGDLDELASVHGMSQGQLRRYGRALLTEIERAQADPPPARPRRNSRPPEAVSARYEKLHNWRKQKARERGVEADVIISRGALWSLAWKNPQTVAQLQDLDGIGPWRLEAYGQELVRLLKGS